MKTLLLNYVNYNLWANTRLCRVIENLEPELWNKELISSFKTIRLTLLHIWDAEQVWYLRLNGKSVNAWPSTGFTGANEELIKQLLSQSELFIEYTDRADEELLAGRCTFNDMKGNSHSIKICDIIQHCMNHSTFHRGQLVTMLRELGMEKLTQTDYIAYIRENNL